MTGDPTTPERPFPPRRPFQPRETVPSAVEPPVQHPQDDQAPPVPEQEERA